LWRLGAIVVVVVIIKVVVLSWGTAANVSSRAASSNV
jgi:hypothetical protein